MILTHIRSSFREAFLPRLPEWHAAGMIFALGWMLSANPDRMATGGGGGYSIMLAIADQPTWSVVLMLFGAIRLLVLLINGAWRRSPWARAAMAFVCCFFWTQIVLSFATTFGFAFILSAGWLVADLVNVFRAMQDARTVDDAYARGASRGAE